MSDKLKIIEEVLEANMKFMNRHENGLDFFMGLYDQNHAALETLKEIQRDYVLVPREPTQIMSTAGRNKGYWSEPYCNPSSVYKAMIGAYENEN